MSKIYERSARADYFAAVVHPLSNFLDPPCTAFAKVQTS